MGVFLWARFPCNGHCRAVQVDVQRIKQQGSSGNMSPISYVAMMVSGAPRPASFERMWHM